MTVCYQSNHSHITALLFDETHEHTLNDAAYEHRRGADAAEHRSIARLRQVRDAQVRAAEHRRGAQGAALEARPRLHHVDAAQLRLLCKLHESRRTLCTE